MFYTKYFSLIVIRKYRLYYIVVFVSQNPTFASLIKSFLDINIIFYAVFVRLSNVAWVKSLTRSQRHGLAQI